MVYHFHKSWYLNNNRQCYHHWCYRHHNYWRFHNNENRGRSFPQQNHRRVKQHNHRRVKQHNHLRVQQHNHCHRLNCIFQTLLILCCKILHHYTSLIKHLCVAVSTIHAYHDVVYAMDLHFADCMEGGKKHVRNVVVLACVNTVLNVVCAKDAS